MGGGSDRCKGRGVARESGGGSDRGRVSGSAIGVGRMEVRKLMAEGDRGGGGRLGGGRGIGGGWLFTSVSARTCRHCIESLW